MRITFVISSLNCGGAQKVISTMANYWAEKGFAITIFTFDDGSTAPFYPLKSNIIHNHLNLSNKSINVSGKIRNQLIKIRSLRKNITQNSPDITISFIHKTNMVTTLALLGTGIPLIISERNDPHWDKIGRFGKVARHMVYPLADLLVVQTKHIRDYFPKMLRSKIQIIPNPVSLPEKFNTKGKPLYLKKPAIIAMGKFQRQKGLDILIKAFSHLKKKHPRWSLTILGDGELRPDFEKLAGSLGLSDCVFFPGVVNNPYHYMQHADLFVMPSRYEGFPNALCEAMAFGLPVITTNFSSAEEIVGKDESAGMIVPIENIPALAKAMDELIRDNNRRKRLASQAQQISNRFELNSIMNQWEKWVQLCINQGRLDK